MIEFRNINFEYNNLVLFEKLNLTFTFNQFHSILGKNGSGKSTLLKLITKLVTPSNGKIKIKNQQRLCYIPADFDFFLNFTLQDLIDIFKNIEKGNAKIDQRKLKETLLKDLDINRSVNSLSSGEKKQFVFYLNLLTAPDILLIDEPDANLDPDISFSIFEYLQGLLDQVTIICVTHNVNLAIRFSNHFTYISNDKKVSQYNNLSKSLMKKIGSELLTNFDLTQGNITTYYIPK